MVATHLKNIIKLYSQFGSPSHSSSIYQDDISLSKKNDFQAGANFQLQYQALVGQEPRLECITSLPPQKKNSSKTFFRPTFPKPRCNDLPQDLQNHSCRGFLGICLSGKFTIPAVNQWWCRFFFCPNPIPPQKKREKSGIYKKPIVVL